MKLWRVEEELKEDKIACVCVCVGVCAHSHVGGRQKQPHKNRKLPQMTVRATGLGRLQRAETIRVSRCVR